MTPEQEAQQAQTIAEITKRLENDEAWMSQSAQSGRDCTIEDRQALLRIVDSQAQKIAEQANELIEAKGANILLNEQNENLRNRVAEQAKEIEQARTIADEWREKAGSKYDPFPWETTDSKEVAR